MKEIILLLNFFIFVLSQANDSIDCDNYLQKFGTEVQPLQMNGEAIYLQESQNVQILIKYQDSLFTDPVYYGLVQEDKKQPGTTCLTLKIFQFTNINHYDPNLLQDLQIETSSNIENKWRYYSFVIPESQLFNITNISGTTYKGFYSFVFENMITKQIIYEFIFDFTILLDKQSGFKIDSSYHSQYSTKQINKLFWCSDIICQDYLQEQPLIKSSQNIYLKQIVSIYGVKDIQLINPEVNFIIDGLIAKVNIINFNNTIPGQVIIKLLLFNLKRDLIINVNSIAKNLITQSQTLVRNSIKATVIKYSIEPPIIDNQISLIRWCSNITCQKILSNIPNLHVNDTFFLQQAYLQSGNSAYYLTKTEVWYSTEVLNKKATIISVNNTIRGQVIIQLKAQMAWKKVTFKVQSTLSTTQTGERRLLVQTEFGTIYGQTDQIECIKAEGEETCASCEEECQINGYTRGCCEACQLSQQIGFVFMSLILIFML